MRNITLFTILVFCIPAILAIVFYCFDLPIPREITPVLISIQFILAAFLITVTSVIIKLSDKEIMKKLQTSGHAHDLLKLLKLTIYILIFTGVVAIIYGILRNKLCNEILLIFSSFLSFCVFFGVGLILKNIRILFMILTTLQSNIKN